jgi:hypothetical protein
VEELRAESDRDERKPQSAGKLTAGERSMSP